MKRFPFKSETTSNLKFVEVYSK